MAEILVTGGAGFIGSCIAEALIDQGHEVVLVDNFLTGTEDRLPSNNKGLTFIKCDVNDYNQISAIMLSRRFDFVFHFAAVVGVQRTLDNPVMVLQDIQGFKNILDLSKNSGVKRVLFSSSSEVYGEPFEHPQNEITTPLNSRLPYAIVKNVGEAFLRSYKQEYGLNYTIFRFFNTYGPKQSIDFVMSRFITAAMQNETITIYGDGSQTRTFCYIDDNVEACIKAMNSSECVDETINIGNDNEISILELANKIIKITGSKSKLIHLPPLKEGDMMRRKPDIRKMKKILGRELTPLEDGIQKVIESGKFS